MFDIPQRLCYNRFSKSLVGLASEFVCAFGREQQTHFFPCCILAYTSLIPFRITSVLVIPVSFAQYSSILTSSSVIRIRVSCFLGSVVGLPVLGDIRSPLFCVTTNIITYGDTEVNGYLEIWCFCSFLKFKIMQYPHCQ